MARETVVLVVNSNRSTRLETLRQLRRDDRLRVVPAASVEEAKHVLDAVAVDVVVSADTLADGYAEDVFYQAMKRYPGISRIILDVYDPAEVLPFTLGITYQYVDWAHEDTYADLIDTIIAERAVHGLVPEAAPRHERVIT